ncbi:hypothetical protein BH721_00905 [Clostridium baratii]|uniref:Uncharacterized protein n=1 Tax=Clostridium baratii TaxID=1561 RepID=A0A174QN44_9CLOT|nr:hypothetical protein [Clostridium baratii]OPF51629.1 hypothetical protein A1M12_03570 [Clostridium baratii]OPF55299.1 hypothetical protein BH721_00905 [Clostridium baratii]OPF57582.1 hypothetical protein BH724_08160 [Clostridium baratii]OPF60320.1 hypothetical protein BH725_07020 [Clostridium baratii]CUP72348.1 Uncharacterised protein [Clostridium baratii]
MGSEFERMTRMNIENLTLIYNKRNCVEKLLLDYLSNEKEISELVLNHLNYCKLNTLDSINNIDNDSFKDLVAYSTYANILNNYVRRENVSYQNINQILKMLDKSKDTIRLFLENNLEKNSLSNNLDEFINWCGISYKFHNNFMNIINADHILKFLVLNFK